MRFPEQQACCDNSELLVSPACGKNEH